MSTLHSYLSSISSMIFATLNAHCSMLPSWQACLPHIWDVPSSGITFASHTSACSPCVLGCFGNQLMGFRFSPCHWLVTSFVSNGPWNSQATSLHVLYDWPGNSPSVVYFSCVTNGQPTQLVVHPHPAIYKHSAHCLKMLCQWLVTSPSLLRVACNGVATTQLVVLMRLHESLMLIKLVVYVCPVMDLQPVILCEITILFAFMCPAIPWWTANYLSFCGTVYHTRAATSRFFVILMLCMILFTFECQGSTQALLWCQYWVSRNGAGVLNVLFLSVSASARELRVTRWS